MIILRNYDDLHLTLKTSSKIKLIPNAIIFPSWCEIIFVWNTFSQNAQNKKLWGKYIKIVYIGN